MDGCSQYIEEFDFLDSTSCFVLPLCVNEMITNDNKYVRIRALLFLHSSIESILYAVWAWNDIRNGRYKQVNWCLRRWQGGGGVKQMDVNDKFFRAIQTYKWEMG